MILLPALRTRLDARAFVRGYGEFEESVPSQVVLHLTTALAAQGFSIRGPSISWRGRTYSVSANQSLATRSTDLRLVPTFDSGERLSRRAYPTGASPTIGITERVLLSAPVDIHAFCSHALLRFVEDLHRAYRELESRCLEVYRCLDDGVYAELDRAVARGFARTNRATLHEHCFLTLTDTRDLTYSYCLGPESVARALTRLKKTPPGGSSPLGAVLTLMGESSTDDFVREGSIRLDRFHAIAFDRLVSRVENPTLWLAESAMYADPDLAARELCRIDDYSLQVCAPQHLSADLEAAVGAAQTSVTRLLRRTIRRHIRRRKQLALEWSRVRATSIWASSPTFRRLTGYAEGALVGLVVEQAVTHPTEVARAIGLLVRILLPR